MDKADKPSDSECYTTSLDPLECSNERVHHCINIQRRSTKIANSLTHVENVLSCSSVLEVLSSILDLNIG
jgi:hypothetical protein